MPTTSRVPSSRPELVALRLGGTSEPWERFGLDVALPVGGVRLVFEGGPPGVNGLALSPAPSGPLDGLVVDGISEEGSDDSRAAEPAPVSHSNGIVGIDHVVVLTDDVVRTTAAFRAAGLDHRPSPAPQEFFVLGPCLLEVAQHEKARPGASLWGITFVGDDLERFGTPKDAVQPGRRIVTVRREAGLGFPVAVISPRGV